MGVAKILFLHTGKFSMVNRLFKEKLPRMFPNAKVTTIDVYDILRKKRGILLVNVYHFLKEYGSDFLLGRRNIKEIKRFFFSTVYILDYIKKYLNEHIDSEQYRFSLQTQSLFDLSVSGLPHYIYTDHTNLCNYFYPTLSLSPARLIKNEGYHSREKIGYDSAQKIFVMGHHTKLSLVHQYQIDESKVIAVGCGGNAKIPNYINPSKYESKTILFVGDQWELKGGMVLVEAFKIIKSYFPEANLNIIGTKPSIANIDGCFAIERVPIEKLVNYYEEASIFCMPSIVETFGMVYVEAMYYGLPIVTNNIGSNSLTIKDGVSGIVTDGSVFQIGQALMELLDDPDKCKRYGNAGYEIATQKYTWDYVLEQMRSAITNEISIVQVDG